MSVTNAGGLERRTRCPGCHAEPSRTLVSEPYSGSVFIDYLARQYGGRARSEVLQPARYELVRCGSCGLAFQRYVPDERLLTEIYDNWIQPSEKERLLDSYCLTDFAYLAEQVQLLIRLLGMQPHAIRALDFGMGWSEWASMARAFGCRVSGAELSTARIQHARSLGFDIVPWEHIPDAQFHFINTEQVLEHLVEPRSTLERLCRALRPGGIVKISVPDARRALGKLSAGRRIQDLSSHELMTVAPLEHINAFDHASLVSMAAMAGLQILRPRIRAVYASGSGWFSPKQALHLLARPVYRHWYPKSTFAYFLKS